MALTSMQVKSAKEIDKPQKLSDGSGLYLLVQPNGAKYWRLNYRLAGKRKTLAVGVYSDVAYRRLENGAKLHARYWDNGADLSAVMKVQKAAVVALTEYSFEIVARDWLSKFSKDNAAEYLPERRRMMQHWADYLGGLAAGADVIPLRANAAAR